MLYLEVLDKWVKYKERIFVSVGIELKPFFKQNKENLILNSTVNQVEKFGEITNTSEFESNFSKEEYLQAVKKVKHYIEEGDVMQVVLAQDFSANFDKDPFELYKAIRKLNPSPYMYFLNLGEFQIVGASPEILVRLENEEVTLRPIAGTRVRGNNLEEDKFNEERNY